MKKRQDNNATCYRCSITEPRDYMVLRDFGQGNVQYVHPLNEGRCGLVSIDEIDEMDYPEPYQPSPMDAEIDANVSAMLTRAAYCIGILAAASYVLGFASGVAQ